MSTDSFHLAEFLPYQLSVASNAVSNDMAGVYEQQFGLKVTEWRVMAMLGDGGPMTQRDLTAKTLMDKVAVNRACKALEMRGLARRSPNQQDGRSHHLELTGDGLSMYRAIVPLVLEREAHMLAPLSKSQQRILRDLLDLVRSHADRKAAR
ncbi:MarR family winged helix-turn-helix transcriptional regulator [Pontixanthobacter sp.]|uniref:MarR family winged helix-turn-helix transcriptional regulator n=1 Tax=Pontixanthobacter sp. TaxID=2792078 RepID=UPI003C7D9370